MSLKNRELAVKLIDTCIAAGASGNYILNQLLKAGFLSNAVTVHASEVKEEIDNAPFKCKTYILDEDDGDAD